MKYLLDTNICIYSFKGLYDLPKKIEAIGYDEFAISEITLAELIFGAYKSQNVRKNMEVVNSFAQSITILPIFSSLEIYGREKARLQTQGRPIGDFDLLIGATAITTGLTVVTRNVREFQRLDNLKVENWVDD